ncbi:hypothetical protein PENFLA_c004G03365 [Penicillium flavigenum]|uniref:CNNM transmembrane domain-containing protein n=1 Tax=Penicillium flavigenum TaxID=254877 RepID=A0A1V6TRP3_9EURO|nr:hypothetical protein PENFLA_c004G03365 [Penicillium flavigenum]
MALSMFAFFLVLAAMAAYYYDELFHLVGSVVVGTTVLVAGTCYFSSPRAWLFGLLQAAAAAALLAEASVVVAEATEASAKEITQMRAQMGLLEQQLRGTEARVRDSEIRRENEKKRHERKVRDLDAQLATVSRRIKESLLAKDRALVECRQWRRKFEDLEHLQQQAQENPVRGKGRPRWAPAKKYGVRKGERGRPDKKLTAVAQVAIVNAAWESKQVRFESEARDYVARTSDQLRSLRAAVTALSEENASLLRKQQTQATHDIPHELAQQQVKDAVRSTMEFADKEHRERVNSLEQTHREKLMAAKADYEERLVKATAELKAAGADAVLAQELQTAVEMGVKEKALEKDIAANEADLDQLRAAHAKTAADLQVKEEELQRKTAEVARLTQVSGDHEMAGKILRKEYEKLKFANKTLVREKEDLKREKEDLELEIDEQHKALLDLADNNEEVFQEAEKVEAKNSELRQELADFRTADINQACFLRSSIRSKVLLLPLVPSSLLSSSISHPPSICPIPICPIAICPSRPRPTVITLTSQHVPLITHTLLMNSSRYRSFAARPLMLSLAKLLLVAISQVPFTTAAPLFSPLFLSSRDTEPPKEPSDPSLWLYLGFSAALVLSGGAFAGLTIALMGQDEVYLQVIKTSGEGHERKNATSVLNLLNHGKHWVLVTLLLSNVITNETLPIVLDRTLGGGWPAVLGSTALIVIFGEIVPQSICVRYGLPIGAWMAPCVLVLMYIMSPVAWPIAKLLDRLLGEDHGTIYKKAGLKTLVTLHKTLGEAGEQLNSDEVTIISAVLDLKEKSVGSIMTPMEDVFTMSADTVLDERTMDHILSQGYSRIPIHAPENPRNFVGMLLVKMLITYDPEDCKRVRDFALATLPETRPETSCLDIVNFFQEGKSHMVLVSEYPSEDRGALGVVTLEDVIEELIGEEIIDESDVFIDVHKAIRRMTPAPKSRVAKGKIVEEPPLNASIITDGDLIDVDPTQPSSLPKPSDLIRRRSSVETPLPRFQLRKTNADINPDSPNESVTQVGTTDEIREHLKHLGPSNLASRPRQTRYHAVKIKRNSTSPSRSAQTDFESGQSTSDSRKLIPSSTGYQGGIGAGLLNSAGTDAKDGAHALKLGYGTMASNGSVNKGTGAQQYKDLPQVSIPEAVREELEDQPRSGSTRKASSDEGSVESSGTPGFIYHHRGPARSGSITEQVVDVNGIRKVVLHANCTSSSEGETHPSGHHRHREHHPTDGAVHDTDDAKSENPDGGHTKSKKKRRRKKHGKASKSDGGPSEDQPLLR